jgi:hypothetical protein
MEYLEAWGTLIHEKNLKSKISCQTPFKDEQACGFMSLFWHQSRQIVTKINSGT